MIKSSEVLLCIVSVISKEYNTVVVTSKLDFGEEVLNSFFQNLGPLRM